jgi:subtilase family serine protease
VTPRSRARFAKNPSAAATFQRAFSTVARDYPGAIWSVSLGQCEDIFSPTDLAAADGAVAAAERAGTTAFAASGDEGGLECLGVHQKDARIPAQGISFPGDLPAATSVGGTTLALTPAGQYLGETASLATPVWAAITALMNQYLTAHGDRPAGFVNPLLYRLARGSPPYRPFHEVTAGTNDFYPAGPGYNMVTGLGTPDTWNLVRDLAPLTGRPR